MSGRRLLTWMFVILVLAVIPGILIPSFACRSQSRDIRDWGVLPHFKFTDENGHEFTDEALRGHPTFVSFLFTRCDSICPVQTAKMQLLQEQTFGTDIKLVSFSVDPDYDTPARLEAYARRFQANPDRWRFVTGPADQMKQLVTGSFMIAMDNDARPGEVPNIAHQNVFMLVDSELHLRGSYDANDMADLDRLQQDARYLARVGH